MDFKEYQEELEMCFLLDCNSEDLKENKEARKTYKIIRKQGKIIRKFYKKINKTKGDIINRLF